MGVAAGSYEVEARVVDGAGEPVSGLYTVDHNVGVGIGGKILVAYGDSISSGKGDDVRGDDGSADGRNLGRGYSPILNDRLSDSLGQAVMVVN
ncbi:hypothetical protein RZS08_65385, partial [Arthrospira platensis SPKY1]|nr:hypothetical protein [Arthrospira platensis SPKY1]